MTRSLAHNAGLRAKPTAWMAAAACAGRADEMYPDMRGGEGVHASARAKAICRTCPVIEPCKEYSMAEPIEPHGVWGGMSPEDRRQLRARRNRLKAVDSRAVAACVYLAHDDPAGYDELADAGDLRESMVDAVDAVIAGEVA